jgi:hypothetical protein
MKLNIRDTFSLEIEDGDIQTVIKGTLKKVTKKQEGEIKAKFKKEYDAIEKMAELTKQAQREKLRADLNGESEDAKKKSSELLEKLYKLQDSIDENEFKEQIAKYRFDMSVESEQLPQLIALAEDFGYGFVLEMINKSVSEAKGNDEAA